MKYEKEQLALENGIKHDWIITNGIGGYSSSTIVGVNSRKYHGLLVAPLQAPGGRHLILSKVDESFESGGIEYPLYSNVCKNYISEGYKNLVRFEKEYIPIFTYEIDGATIKKFICMDYGKNTVCILYHIQNNEKRTKLTVTPIVHFRDFHCTTPNAIFTLQQEIKEKKVKLVVNNRSSTPVYFYASEGIYKEHKNDTFNRRRKKRIRL